MDITSRLGGLALDDTTSSSLAYVIGVNGTSVYYLHPSSSSILSMVATAVSTATPLVRGQLFNLKRSNQPEGEAISFLALNEKDQSTYVNRAGVSFCASSYKQWILPSLLLGSRLRDYDQACATVIERTPLIFSAPPRPVFLKKLQLRAETGEIVEVIVDNVNREGEKSNRFFCTPLMQLPASVIKGARLQFIGDIERIPPITQVLHAVYEGTRPLSSRLLDYIYSEAGAYSYSPVSRELIKQRKKNGTLIILNAEQSEAVWRYNDSKCPAFVVESPPGTGKTLTAAAMACSYKGSGLQLFISTANVPVFNMACALAELDYGARKIVHLISADREASLQDQRSPFSLFETEDEEEGLNPNLARFEVLKRKKNVPVIKMKETRRHAAAVMPHNEPFYHGRLRSAIPDSNPSLLSVIFKDVTMHCAFFRVKKSKADCSGTSLINDAEIGVLNDVINKLRIAGYDHRSVMVISYYEAQRKLAVANLPPGYEVLTVDSAQGREKDIVIVLTTTDSTNASTFFTCHKRCNVAVSRQKAALIILGSEALEGIEPWNRVLSKKYFSTVDF